MAGVECGSLDVSKISEDDIIISENNLSDKSVWVRADVDEKIYVKPDEDPKNPYVVIKFSDGCFATICENTNLTDINKSLLFYSSAIVSALSENKENNNDPSAPTGSSSSDKKATTICGVDINILKEAQKRVDASSINEKGFQAAAVIPAEAVIPMKSNILTYGPYASSNFTTSCGGTQAEVNTDLCPWVFGSTTAMHQAGQSLVNSGIVGLTRAETGSVTVTGLPNITSLGFALSSGPNLTSVNTNFGSSGITTTYEWRTYTPKIGGLNRAYIDRIKRIAKNRQENIKFLRSNQINQIKVNRKIRTIQRNNAIANLNKTKNADKCLHRVMIGEMYDFRSIEEGSGQRTIVGTETLSKSIVEMKYDYDKKAYISLDGLFGPVSVSGLNNNNLPRYIKATESSEVKHVVSPIHAQPPFTTGICDNPSVPANGLDQNNLRINNLYLNPLSNPKAIPHYDPASVSGSPGHCIDIVGRETEVPDSGLITNFYDFTDPKRYSSDYRFLGMRGPIVLHAWGYDIDGKPIPNAIDKEIDTKQGVFKTEDTSGGGLKDEFMKDWLLKPGTWPTGPIDLRFDRERGVWVSPQPFKVVVARIIKEVPKCSSGIGVILNKDASRRYGKKLYNSKGEPVTEDAKCKSLGDCTSEQSFDPPQENEECDKWILVNVGSCPSQTEDDLNITLSLQNNQLVLTYTFKGITKTTAVGTTTCDSVQPSTSSSTSSTSSISTSTSSTSSSSSSTTTSSTSSTSPDNSEVPIINIADRVGLKHKIGDIVYAYYDTYSNEYIVLESNNSSGASVIAYGYISSTKEMTVEGYSGGGLSAGDKLKFENPLNLSIDYNCPDSSVPCIVAKVSSC